MSAPNRRAVLGDWLVPDVDPDRDPDGGLVAPDRESAELDRDWLLVTA